MSIRHRIPHVIAILVLAVIPLACTSVFPVAVLIPETGASEAYGTAVRRGVELAMDELRTNGGGEHLDITFHDTQSDPQVARSTLEGLFGSDTLVAIGGVTPGETDAMVEVAEQNQRVLLSPVSGNERLSQNAAFFYRLAISDLTAGSTMADFSRRELHLDNVLLLAENEDLLQGLELGFRSTFESAGGAVVDAVVAPTDDAELQALLASGPIDGIFVDATPSRVGGLIGRLREQGFNGKILTTEALASPSVIEAIGDHAVDVLLTKAVLEASETNPRATDFIASYRDAYGEMPDIFAAQAYDAVHVLALALQGRPAIPSSVRKGLRDEIKDYTGATGMIQFSSGGSINRYPRVYRIAEDLSLVDHAQELRIAREEKERRRKELMAKIQNIRSQGAGDTDTADEGSEEGTR